MNPDKPFDPTPSRLERARREGDLPRANDAVALGAFAVALGVFVATALPAAAAARSALTEAARGRSGAWPYCALAAYALLPAGGSIAGAVGAHWALAGRIGLRFRPIELARFNPLRGLRELLSREAVLAIVKATVAALAMACALRPALFAALVQTSRGGDPAALAAIVGSSAAAVVLTALAVAAPFALVDAGLQRRRWRRQLRMDVDELKRDHKANEGDPMLRGRRRKAHGALVSGSLGRVREAAFVVVNPDHIAVALAYAPPRIAVPLVVVRAAGAGALTVKRRAVDLGIPIVEDAPLARELFRLTRAGACIPRSAYDAVARIVAALLSAGGAAG
jgi:flagellar biosynthesis protein FlhB